MNMIFSKRRLILSKKQHLNDTKGLKEEESTIGTNNMVLWEGDGFHVQLNGNSDDVHNQPGKKIVEKVKVGQLKRIIRLCRIEKKSNFNGRDSGGYNINNKQRGHHRKNSSVTRSIGLPFFQNHESTAYIHGRTTMSTQPSSHFDRQDNDVVTSEYTNDQQRTEVESMDDSIGQDEIRISSTRSMNHNVRRKVARQVLTSLLTEDNESMGPFEDNMGNEQNKEISSRCSDAEPKIDRYTPKRFHSHFDSVFDGINDEDEDEDDADDSVDTLNAKEDNEQNIVDSWSIIFDCIKCYGSGPIRQCQRSPKSDIVMWDDTVVLSELSY